MKCPFCANEIKDGAVKCQFCETKLNGIDAKKLKKDGQGKFKTIICRRDVIIIVLCIIIIGLSGALIKVLNQVKIDTFEKKKMCTEMRDSYEIYLENTRDYADSFGGHTYSQKIGDVDLFYNTEYDSCIGVYDFISNDDGEEDIAYIISDYMNGNNEILWCSMKRDPECYYKRTKQVEELKK